MRAIACAVLLILAGCSAPASISPAKQPVVSPVGLVTLPCDGKGPLRPHIGAYCWLGRAWVTPQARAALVAIADRFVRRHPDSVVLFMDASGASGKKPFAPHLSHGDGREVDLAVFYRTPAGLALTRPPTLNGYSAYEPPRPGDPVACKAGQRPGDRGDPPASRGWRLDDGRTRDLVALLSADARVRRVLIEPHLKHRFGMDRDIRLRFAGCWAARHDDHIHVDFL